MLTRRSLLAGLAGTAGLHSTSALAGLACSPFNQMGIQQCTAGIEIGEVVTARQECKLWCWAASIQTIFALHNHHVEQKRIAEKLFGGPVCQSAIGPQIIGAVNGAWTDDQGAQFTASAFPLLDLQFGVWDMNAAARVAQELAYGYPLINGAVGHATVLTAMTYLRDVYGRGMPIEIVVRDPWPYSPNRRSLNAQEVAGTNFLAIIRVS